MRAWLMETRDGGVDKLRLADVPDPRPGAGEVVLDVRYAGLNPADRYLSEAQYPSRPPLPHVLGRDGVGTVAEVGPGVTQIKTGDRYSVLRGEVGVSRWGTFAERVAVPVESLVPVPQGWTEPQAAGATLVYLTAYQAITQWPDLPGEGAALLVTGASGGVGVATVQLAAAMGHRLIGLSRDAGKRERVKELGAAAAFDPAEPTWRKHVKELLGGRGVDLAIDNIGGTLLPDVIETLGRNGRVSVVGRLAGPVPQFNTATLFFRRLKIGGVHVGAYSNADARAAWSAVLEMLKRTGARPLVDSEHPFDQLPQAFERLARGPMGKVLLRVSGS
jgi:NADPH2:quinone reductase